MDLFFLPQQVSLQCLSLVPVGPCQGAGDLDVDQNSHGFRWHLVSCGNQLELCSLHKGEGVGAERELPSTYFTVKQKSSLGCQESFQTWVVPRKEKIVPPWRTFCTLCHQESIVCQSREWPLRSSHCLLGPFWASTGAWTGGRPVRQ